MGYFAYSNTCAFYLDYGALATNPHIAKDCHQLWTLAWNILYYIREGNIAYKQSSRPSNVKPRVSISLSPICLNWTWTRLIQGLQS